MSPRNTSVRRVGVREGARKRAFYDESFKLKVVCSALARPCNNRIKPTCACYPGIEPCQVRPSPSPSARAGTPACTRARARPCPTSPPRRVLRLRRPNLKLTPPPPPPMQLRKWIRNLETLARERMAAQETSLQAPLCKRATPAACRESAPSAKRMRPFVGRTTAPPPLTVPARQSHMLSPLYDLGLSRSSPDTPDLMCESSRSSSVCTSPSHSPRHNFGCDPRLMTHASVPLVDLAALPAARPLAPVADKVRLLTPLMVVQPFAVLGNVYAQGGASYAPCWQPQQPHTAAAVGRFKGAGHDEERMLSVDMMAMDSLLEEGLGDELGDELFANEVDDSDAPGWVEDWLSELMGGN